MSCKEYTEWLAYYAIDGLAPQDKAELEKHLKSCDECRVELAQLLATVKILSYDVHKPLTEVEKLNIEREVFRKLSSQIHHRETKGKRIIRLMVQIAAAIIIFIMGYYMQAVINDDTGEGQMLTTVEQIRQVTDYSQICASTMRFSKEGLTLIAKGKKSLSDVIVQEQRNQ
jgi:anti-sigma factor RsiW